MVEPNQSEPETELEQSATHSEPEKKKSTTKKGAPPLTELEVEYVYGYRSNDCQQNL